MAWGILMTIATLSTKKGERVMGMSTHIKAFRDLDGEFKKMLDAKLYCERAGLSYPQEVKNYFGDNVGESAEYLMDEYAETEISYRDWTDEGAEGFEVDVASIPKDVKTIRFYNSY